MTNTGHCRCLCFMDYQQLASRTPQFVPLTDHGYLDTLSMSLELERRETMHEDLAASTVLAPEPYDAPAPETSHADRALVHTTGLIGHSAAMRTLRATIARYARTCAPVVIHGETGTGKELVARAIHHLGPRAARPFIAANVAVLTETLAASQLFGHERGAFTGALARHRGYFEQANEGTLLLDEIAELTPENQARLLRALEAGEIQPVGAERSRTVSVRLVVASHVDLAAQVRAGFFRDDLFYRLHALTITVPPLRSRIVDMPELTAHLLARLEREVGVRRLDPEALRPLQAYAWPGNVRQLANVLRRAAVQSDDALLGADDLWRALREEPEAPQLANRAALAATIEGFLRAEGGRIAPTARRLGIARSTLRAHIKRFAIRLDP